VKKILTIALIILNSFTFNILNANAGETGEPIGGFAVVNPETGIVHGVITGSIEYFGSNNRTMGHEYMGCPAGCLIVQQSTADQNGNVVGVNTNENIEVKYVQDRNIFQVFESNVIQNQNITESVSNTILVETEIVVSRSQRAYEFGVQDFVNKNAEFVMNEISPSQDTSAEILATTKEYACIDEETSCSRTLSNSSQILNNESILFNERSTGNQVLDKVINESKNKIREQLNLILNMLGKWIIE
jgi:hypothetical protein